LEIYVLHFENLREDYRLIVERRLAPPNDTESNVDRKETLLQGHHCQTGQRVGARRHVDIWAWSQQPKPDNNYRYETVDEAKTYNFHSFTQLIPS
jgi:hypothetical protein